MTPLVREVAQRPCLPRRQRRGCGARGFYRRARHEITRCGLAPQHPLLAAIIAGGSAAPGQIVFSPTGADQSWTVPAGVTSICILCVGASGPTDPAVACGGGCGLSYLNNVAVTPGEILTIRVPYHYDLVQAYVKRGATVLCRANSGGVGVGGAADTTNGATSYAGGRGAGGGGGAAGYAANGADGADPTPGTNGANGAGGGGGGGGFANYTDGGGGGGGVGLLGQGPSGTGGTSGTGWGGLGGSGGEQGAQNYPGGYLTAAAKYGGGPGVVPGLPSQASWGAVRILWGVGRSYPSTNTGNV